MKTLKTLILISAMSLTLEGFAQEQHNPVAGVGSHRSEAPILVANCQTSDKKYFLFIERDAHSFNLYKANIRKKDNELVGVYEGLQRTEEGRFHSTSFGHPNIVGKDSNDKIIFDYAFASTNFTSGLKATLADGTEINYEGVSSQSDPAAVKLKCEPVTSNAESPPASAIRSAGPIAISSTLFCNTGDGKYTLVVNRAGASLDHFTGVIKKKDTGEVVASFRNLIWENDGGAFGFGHSSAIIGKDRNGKVIFNYMYSTNLYQNSFKAVLSDGSQVEYGGNPFVGPTPPDAKPTLNCLNSRH